MTSLSKEAVKAAMDQALCRSYARGLKGQRLFNYLQLDYLC